MDYFERMKRDREENNYSFKNLNIAVEKTLKKEEPNIVRLVSSEYVKYLRCWALSDPDETGNRRTIPVISWNEVEGQSLFGQMLGDEKNFYKGGILETYKDGNLAVPKYQAADPDLINLLFNKNDLSGRSGSWKPRREYIFNVIDRDPEIIDGRKVLWCVENKKTKVLRFIPMAFDSLVACMENEGPDVENYDIAYMIRTSKNRTTHYIQKAGAMLRNVVTGPLTPEELEYEKWDLLDCVKLSSATFCLKWFRQTIERISEVMGIDWIGMFEQQAKLELESKEEERIVEQPEVQPIPRTQPSTATVSPRHVATEVKPAAYTAKMQELKTASQPMHTSNTVRKTPPEPVTKMQESKTSTATHQGAVQSNIVNTIKQETLNPAPIRSLSGMKDATTQSQPSGTIKCGHCGKVIPADSETCPVCRGLLLAPCDKCGKLFSVFETECPHCGAKYILS